MQRNLQQLLLLPDSAIKGIQTERQKQNLPSSASFAEKKKQMLPVPFGEQAAGREKQAASLWVTCW